MYQLARLPLRLAVLIPLGPMKGRLLHDVPAPGASSSNPVPSEVSIPAVPGSAYNSHHIDRFAAESCQGDDPVPHANWYQEVEQARRATGAPAMDDQLLIDVFASDERRCAHCGVTGHSVLKCGWIGGMSNRHLEPSGLLRRRSIVVSQNGYVGPRLRVEESHTP